MSILTAEDVEVNTSTCQGGVCKLTPVQATKKTRTVKAVKAQVYSRVVGYYTPTDGWNRGKKEEFKDRHMMSVEDLASVTKS